MQTTGKTDKILNGLVLVCSYHPADRRLQQAQGENQGAEGPSSEATKAASPSNEVCHTLLLMECCCQGVG